MKTVVITGSARGLGFEMAKLFKKANLNVVISDLKEENGNKAKEELDKIESQSKVEYKVCNVTNIKDIQELIEFTKNKFDNIDIWINNAGVNQPDKAIWELTEQEINMVLDVDLKGAIIGSKLVMEEMSKQHKGAIYNIEGYGSNDVMMLGLSIYGTSKRAITYFTQALAK
ncbi:MAG: SDR family NAD(P)-dependent oxidoreductase [Candidatus Coprovivens sp.]